MTDNSALYDLSVYGDGEKIDEFIVAGDPPDQFDPIKWIEAYKRYFPMIATNYKTITIKYVTRG